MKMRPGEKLILPLWFRTALVLALLVTLASAYHFRLNNSSLAVAETMDHGRIVDETQLRFVDHEGGIVSVIDANNDQEIARLDTGEDGFMRSVMRGMVRERKARGLGAEVPFQLTLWESGLVSLIDPATERRVELSAFGVDNVAAFSRLLPGSITRQPAS